MREWLTPNVRKLLPSAIAEAANILSPTSRDVLVKALSSCLTLVAPAGMGEGERRAWLTSASMALKDIPIDLLERGVTAARLVVDHPSKIIPAIVGEVKIEWDRRKFDLAKLQTIDGLDRTPPKPWERVDTFDPADRPTPEEAASIIADIEAQTGVTFNRENPSEGKRHSGPARMPTWEDYIAMGIDPSAIDTRPSTASGGVEA